MDRIIRAAEVKPGLPRLASTVEEPFALVIFGARGNLASTKLFPALIALWQQGFFRGPWIILGVGRAARTDEQFRQELREKMGEHLASGDEQVWPRFAQTIFYETADATQPAAYGPLAERLRKLETQHKLSGNRLFYLAVDPDYFAPSIENLVRAGLMRREAELPKTRVVIEKPFGKDLASALALDAQIHRFLHEDQLYRIDHYLGKETVQNILSFRFGNSIFEPIFNRRYVDHVEITMAETVGVEERADFYDDTGALRDVVQNHVLQLLALTAMEPPGEFGAKEIRDEKVKVLRSLSPFPAQGGPWVVRGQYGPGVIGDDKVPGYRQEKGVPPDSVTETYVAMRVQIDTWRWAGVPFLLRAGKRLPKRITEISVEFKLPPLRLFTTVHCIGDECDVTNAEPNLLVLRIQPDEGISLTFATKRPGMRVELEPVRMDFFYRETFKRPLPSAYERLLLDALRGDGTLFTRSDEVTAAWEFVTPILEEWRKQPPPQFPNYAAGTWGPAEADALVEGCQTGWRIL
jgi:glucose-6-phosphate 1-dehydrogenase